METVGDKIKRLRDSLGESQEVFAERFGVTQATVSRWEKDGIVKRKLQKPLAELAKLKVPEFFHSDVGPRVCSVIGEVSAGGRFAPFVEQEADQIALEMPLDCIAVRVRGESMAPAYRDGDVVIARQLHGREISRAVNRDCIIMTDEDEAYLKILMADGKSYRLRSHNIGYDDITPKRVKWAAPVIWVYRAF